MQLLYPLVDVVITISSYHHLQLPIGRSLAGSTHIMRLPSAEETVMDMAASRVTNRIRSRMPQCWRNFGALPSIFAGSDRVASWRASYNSITSTRPDADMRIAPGRSWSAYSHMGKPESPEGAPRSLSQPRYACSFLCQQPLRTPAPRVPESPDAESESTPELRI